MSELLFWLPSSLVGLSPVLFLSVNRVYLEQSSHNKTGWRTLFYLPRVLPKSELVTIILLVVIGILATLGVIGEINKYFSDPVPAFGGTLKEGIIGNPRFINPLLAQTDADRDVVSLVFTGLLRHDGEGNLRNALANRYEISPDGLQYTVTLKDNLRWSDGTPLTATDVVFTVQLAKNPQIQSPKRANWEGVEVEEVDPRTVRFRLKKAYTPFVENLTLGIMAKHQWERVPLSQFSLVDFNIKPIGAGPYKIQSVKKDSVGSIVSIKLSANKNFALGKPHIKTIVLHFYPSEEAIIKNIKNGFLNSSGALSPQALENINQNAFVVHPISLQRIIAVFFNSNSNKQLGSLKIRQALDTAIDKKELIKNILNNHGIVATGPLPARTTHSDDRITEDSYDPEVAKKIIGTSKEKISVALTTTSNVPEFTEVAKHIKTMWEAAGVSVEIRTFDQNDLEQSVIGPRRYEAFLYGEEIVGEHPDPFAFWHSSQRTHPGLNIALYANSKVDALLENVRTEKEAAKQQKLYQQINDEINKDTPATFLYSPLYLYVTPHTVQGVNIKNINTASERFDTVHEWYLKQEYVWKFFPK